MFVLVLLRAASCRRSQAAKVSGVRVEVMVEDTEAMGMCGPLLA